MNSILDWLKSPWRYNGGRTLLRGKKWKRKQQLKAYWEQQCVPVRSLPRVRPRALTIGKSGHPERNTSLTLPESRLLSLPPEVRLLIWEWTFGGNLIAFYREDDRLTHGLLDETNSRGPGRDVPVHTETIRTAVMLLPGFPRKHVRNPPRPSKLRPLALLQSCRLIYSEGIDILYSCNTFIFLQNGALCDFHRAILPERFASIRSVHIHWKSRECDTQMAKWPWRAEAFTDTLCLARKITNLVHLSIFIQGPLERTSTYGWILSDVKEFHAQMTSPPPKLFVLRLPYPVISPTWGDRFSQGIEEMINDQNLPFQIVRPSHEFPGDMADQDTGADFGWRHGVLFLPSDDGTSGFVMRSYTVWTPMPPGTRWPCMI